MLSKLQGLCIIVAKQQLGQFGNLFHYPGHFLNGWQLTGIVVQLFDQVRTYVDGLFSSGLTAQIIGLLTQCFGTRLQLRRSIPNLLPIRADVLPHVVEPGLDLFPDVLDSIADTFHRNGSSDKTITEATEGFARRDRIAHANTGQRTVSVTLSHTSHVWIHTAVLERDTHIIVNLFHRGLGIVQLSNNFAVFDNGFTGFFNTVNSSVCCGSGFIYRLCGFGGTSGCATTGFTSTSNHFRVVGVVFHTKPDSSLLNFSQHDVDS